MSKVGSKSTDKPNERERLLQKDADSIEKAIADEAEKEEKGSTLVVAFLLMLFFQLGNRIFGRLETFPMHNYPLFMNMLCTVVYVPICFAYIIPMLKLTTVISKEQQEIPKYKFGVMGFYDSVANIMQTFAVNYISNSSTIVLVQQSAIPISMIISKFTLNAQYTKSQYWGAFVVMFGIFLVLLPTLTSSHSSTSTTTTTNTESNNYELLWIFVMMISCIPMCLSSVYKEQALGETEIDVIYLNGWVAVFQSIFAIPLCVPSSQVINLPLSEIIPNMIGGAYCWVGINTRVNTLDGTDDHCEMAPLYVTIYLAFNVIYNFLIVVILKHGSANILWMASTVIVPLSNVAFSLKFMPGSAPLKSMDLVGLFVIMFGLVLYRFMAPIYDYSRHNFPSIMKLCLIIEDDDEDVTEEELASKHLISKQAERKQTKYVGFNQIESLNTFIDTRVYKETQKKTMLYRSTHQIRGNLLVKLGIPPSPHISMKPAVPIGINYMNNSSGTSSSTAMARATSRLATPILSSSYTTQNNNTNNNNSGMNNNIYTASPAATTTTGHGTTSGGSATGSYTSGSSYMKNYGTGSFNIKPRSYSNLSDSDPTKKNNNNTNVNITTAATAAVSGSYTTDITHVRKPTTYMNTNNNNNTQA